MWDRTLILELRRLKQNFQFKVLLSDLGRPYKNLKTSLAIAHGYSSWVEYLPYMHKTLGPALSNNHHHKRRQKRVGGGCDGGEGRKGGGSREKKNSQ